MTLKGKECSYTPIGVVSVSIAMAVWAGIAAPARAQTVLNEEAKLPAPGGATSDTFGQSVGLSGDVMIVGVNGDDDLGSNSGSAYIYRYNGLSWGQPVKLTASDGAANDQFGYAVAVSGQTVVVGAVNDDGTGSAYVFRFDGSQWNEEAKLVASDAASGDNFGYQVGIDGDVVIVGAWLDDDAGSGSGAAYVYRFDGSDWQPEAKLTALDAAAGDGFGEFVSISGNAAIIGAPFNDDFGSNSGSAYIFRFNGSSWVQEAKFAGAGTGPNDRFGDAVAISGDAVAVAAPFDDDFGSNAGAVYMFRYDGMAWNAKGKLTASDAAAEDLFGFHVSMCGDVLAVGARNDDDMGTDSGSAYIFRYDGTTWDEDVKLVASDGTAFDYGGYAVAVCGNAVVSAPFDDIGATNTGSVYFYQLVVDSDGDGLSDEDELVYETDPYDPDTDDDGFLDSTEVMMAEGTGCPSPINPDSDGDTILDGAEADLGTSPCSADTDGDGVADNIDDQPTEPGVSAGFIEAALVDVSNEIQVMSLGSFEGRNDNSRKGRRTALGNKLQSAARDIADGDLLSGYDKILNDILPKIDGDASPSDWMENVADRDALFADLDLITSLIAWDLIE